MKVGKEVRAMMKYAEGYGFTFDDRMRGSGHFKLVHKKGGIVFVSATPGAASWRRNTEATIRRVAREAEGCSR